MAFKLRGPGGSGMMGGGDGERKLRKRMIRDHPGVLQNIEFALLQGYRDDRSIDDTLVLQALQATLNDEAPEDQRAQKLVENVKGIREVRSQAGTGGETPDDVWRDGLRVIISSVRFHSSLKPGATNYLDFVSQYVL